MMLFNYIAIGAKLVYTSRTVEFFEDIEVPKLRNFFHKCRYLCVMGKIIAIDYGAARCGLAITDDLKMIASPLDTFPRTEILSELKKIVSTQKIERFVIGVAKRLDGSASGTTELIEEFILKLRTNFPEMPISRVNEMFTSQMAAHVTSQSGMKKSDREKKGNLDKISAAIILQTYLQYGEG
jgi:putative holliday junction resolvase